MGKWAIRHPSGKWFSSWTDNGMGCWGWERDTLMRVTFPSAYRAETLIDGLEMDKGVAIVLISPEDDATTMMDHDVQQSVA